MSIFFSRTRANRKSTSSTSRKSCPRRSSILGLESLEDRRVLAITLEPIGTYETGVFDEGAAEIVTYDTDSEQLFVINSNDQSVDVLDISDPTIPSLSTSLDLSSFGERPTSVTIHDGLVAVSVLGKTTRHRGTVALFETDGDFIGSIKVGYFPDMVTFTPDGSKLLVANEGQPDDAYRNDPEGTVSIIDATNILSGGIRGNGGSLVTTAKFNQFNTQVESLRADGVHLPGLTTTVAKNLEPEYIAVSPDSSTAWVTLQENNALGELDIASGTFVAIHGLGFKDHSLAGNGLDASDRDDAINIANWPVKSMYQPDAITSYLAGEEGEVFLVTANEGDARDTDGFSEEERVGDITLASPLADIPGLQDDANLGRLRISTDPPTGKTVNKQGEATFSELYAYGTRSFSIWNGDGELVYDSGDDFEQVTAAQFPDNFNSDNDENTFDSRSDDKGPEPEAVTLGDFDGRTYAFVGLERIGGIMIYDVTDPHAVEFSSYINNRDFTQDAETGDSLDLGIEGVKFISAADSPTGETLLVTSNEVSGTTTIFRVGTDEAPAAAAAAADRSEHGPVEDRNENDSTSHVTGTSWSAPAKTCNTVNSSRSPWQRSVDDFWADRGRTRGHTTSDDPSNAFVFLPVTSKT